MTARAWVLPAAQLAAVVGGFVALSVVKGVYVPELVYDVLIPAAYAALCLAGVVRVRRDGRRPQPVPAETAVAVGTTVCGVLMALTVALTLWWNFCASLAGF